MRKSVLFLLATLLFAFALSGVSAGETGTEHPTEDDAVDIAAETAIDTSAEADGELDEWTVLFYLCGSDLESRYSYASGNLKDICGIRSPESLLPMMADEYGVDYSQDAIAPLPKVNVLLQTGGSEEWHAEQLNMHIDPNSLQRWELETESLYNPEWIGNSTASHFTLLDTLPVQSMADAATLTDFIRWGVRARPAKKYALVLWDHGGGAKTGLIIDELYEGDVLYLYELKQALADAETRFEAVVFDACLMANLETAWAIKDNANWMVASEEIVPGRGTAIRDWLQELLNHPECNGEQLGCNICDMTQIQYANLDDEQARALLTWSVIDLSGVDRLGGAFDRFFQTLDSIYSRYPRLAMYYASMFLEAEEYGDGRHEMRDFAGVLYNQVAVWYVDHRLRADLLDALSAAVDYVVRGPGRSAARGLSFCYPNGFSDRELDIYVKNCPSPHYLAFLDAMSDWTAPDWVYDTVERLPEIGTIDALRIDAARRMHDGLPGLLLSNSLRNVHNLYYRLYRLDEETGQTLLIGRTVCRADLKDNGELIWLADDPMHWPAIDGVLCCMELVLEDAKRSDLDFEYVYNIPVQIDDETCFLRCGHIFSYDESKISPVGDYEVYGVWAGYDENTDMANRSVKSLAHLAGQEYRMKYPVDTGVDDGMTVYQIGEKMKMYRTLDVEEIALPAGTYYLEYETMDMFLRPTVLKRIELHWDGENITYPEGFEWSDDEPRPLSELQ